MRLGSLFSGIGGLELGLELALGCEVVWQVEREPWPRAVLARHWPDADRSVTDVCKAGAANLAPVDLVCGGFPCQDISPAGSGKGIEHGKKSGLWKEYARILRELRPSYVVVENSAALPSRGLDIVLGDLASIGYDAEWARIGACDVGAPHRRWRCFVVAWHDSDAHKPRCTRAPGSRVLGARREAIVSHRLGAAVADTDSIGWPRQRHNAATARDVNRTSAPVADSDVDGLHPPEVDEVRTRRYEPIVRTQPGGPTGRDAVPSPSVRRVAHGVPTWLGDGPVPRAITGPELRTDGRAALRALGNAVVPAVAHEVGLWLARIIEREGV